MRSMMAILSFLMSWSILALMIWCADFATTYLCKTNVGYREKGICATAILTVQQMIFLKGFRWFVTSAQSAFLFYYIDLCILNIPGTNYEIAIYAYRYSIR
jgi:hypothetical protein